MPKRKASPKYMATTKLSEAGIKELQEGIDAIRNSKLVKCRVRKAGKNAD